MAILSSKYTVFPSNYTVYRLEKNHHGESVLIAVLDTLSSVACPQYDRDNIELIWIHLICSGKPVLFGVFYRPPNSPDSYLLELHLYYLQSVQFLFAEIST